MRRITRARPSPAAVIAVLALLAAMTTTAVAGPGASTSVTKKRVRTIAIKIAQNTTRKQLNRRFPVGSGRLAGINTRTAQVAVPASPPIGTQFSTTANCNPGEKLIAGGVRSTSESLTIVDSHKSGEGWRGRVTSSGSPSAQTVTVEAYCLAP